MIPQGHRYPQVALAVAPVMGLAAVVDLAAVAAAAVHFDLHFGRG
jgi:hypothetical protein